MYAIRAEKTGRMGNASLDEAKDEAESYDSRVRLGGAKVKYFNSYE
jgi:hypothetical protein